MSERKMIVIQMLNFWAFEGMFVMGGVLCLVRMCCDFGTPDLGERNQQNRTPCFIWYVETKKCIGWNTLFDIAFQMIKNYLTGFVAMQDFILKTSEKFGAVFPEVTLHPWVILESNRLLSNVGNKIAKQHFKQWAQLVKAYCSFCRIKHLGVLDAIPWLPPVKGCFGNWSLEIWAMGIPSSLQWFAWVTTKQ